MTVIVAVLLGFINIGRFAATKTLLASVAPPALFFPACVHRSADDFGGNPLLFQMKEKYHV